MNTNVLLQRLPPTPPPNSIPTMTAPPRTARVTTFASTGFVDIRSLSFVSVMKGKHHLDTVLKQGLSLYSIERIPPSGGQADSKS